MLSWLYKEVMIFHRVVISLVIYDIPGVTIIFYGHTRYPAQIAKVREETGKMYTCPLVIVEEHRPQTVIRVDGSSQQRIKDVLFRTVVGSVIKDCCKTGFDGIGNLSPISRQVFLQEFLQMGIAFT